MKQFLIVLLACTAFANASLAASETANNSPEQFTKVYNAMKARCSEDVGCDTSENSTNFVVIFNYAGTSNIRTIANSKFDNILVNLGKSPKDSIELSHTFNIENAQVLNVYDTNHQLNALFIYMANGNSMIFYTDGVSNTWACAFYYNRLEK